MHARDGDVDTTFNGTDIQILEGPTDELDIQIICGCIDADDCVLVAAFAYDPSGGKESETQEWRHLGLYS